MKKLGKENSRMQISELFNKAKTDRKNSKKHIKNARRLAQKNRIRLGAYKKTFCSSCNTLFTIGKNCTIRKHPRYVSITCICGKTTRIPISSHALSAKAKRK